VNASYLGVQDIAEMLSMSPWSVYDKARTGRLPHRKPPGSRKLLFLEDEVRAWVDGAELEVFSTAGGGRVCRPIP
jgi:predicted DNA-binding transcriptional regulator AlpA